MSQKAVSDIVDELELKSVTNAADEEDITVIEENGKQKLKFADRNYDLVLVARDNKRLNELKSELEVKYKIKVKVEGRMI